MKINTNGNNNTNDDLKQFIQCIIDLTYGKFLQKTYIQIGVILFSIQILNTYIKMLELKIFFFLIYPLIFIGSTLISLRQYKETDIWGISFFYSALIVNAFCFNIFN